jgi:hypothetical protein
MLPRIISVDATAFSRAHMRAPKKVVYHIDGVLRYKY